MYRVCFCVRAVVTNLQFGTVAGTRAVMGLSIRHVRIRYSGPFDYNDIIGIVDRFG